MSEIVSVPRSSDLRSIVTPRPRILDRLARRSVFRRLERLQRGRLHVRDPLGEQRFGVDGPGAAVAIEVHDLGVYRALVTGGSLGASEAYIDGAWRSDDLAGLIRLLLADRNALDGLEGGAARWLEPLRRLAHTLRRNTKRGARRNIAAHYDLGNDFFAAFLDPTLTYSCALFESLETDLESAQQAKYDRLCRRLALRPEHRLLEIGTGWGGFAIHAATRYGCHVTTTTISRAQYELARERVREAGLENRITLLFDDYRDLRGRFDRLVSIEMIEAVGHAYLDEFFRCCSERLEPDGRMALQAITIAEQHYEAARHSVDFIKRYVFPGGHLPSVAAIAGCVARATDLRFSQLESLTPHCAETLRRWCARFEAQRDALRQSGYPESLLRLWEFYLRYCEAGFEARHIGLVQLVLDKPEARG